MDWVKLEGKNSEKDFFESLNWASENIDNLKEFAPILWAIQNHFSSISDLTDQKVLELGTGRKTALADFFETRLGIENFQCVSLPKFKTNLQSYRFEDINENLKNRKKSSLNLIYGRFLFEENSYHPVSLLFSKQFGNMILKGKKPEVMEKLPGSPEYLAETCRLCTRALKQGGLLISMVVDRSKAVCIEQKDLPRHLKLLQKIAIGTRMGLTIIEKQKN